MVISNVLKINFHFFFVVGYYFNHLFFFLYLQSNKNSEKINSLQKSVFSHISNDNIYVF